MLRNTVKPPPNEAVEKYKTRDAPWPLFGFSKSYQPLHPFSLLCLSVVLLDGCSSFSERLRRFKGALLVPVRPIVRFPCSSKAFLYYAPYSTAAIVLLLWLRLLN